MSSADVPPNPYEGDPDFAFLQVERQKMIEIQRRPFDGKKNVWIPEDKEGFIRAEILSTKGDEVTVLTEVLAETTAKKDVCQQMNPPKFELIADMANMTFLNEASVLNNLRQRYFHSLIYTYSGLFCVVINPYRRLPIYSPNVISKYQGKRKSEMPPHLFAVADNAYRNMLQDRENQSILVTGESGAGKTENTKKVISYFANVAASSKADKEAQAELRKGGTLEDAIIQANPVMEAFGNAKTMRNNNSSRFGKFIRIHFGTKGKIAGADIETYLLEKSRVTYQQPGKERNYHIYYWLLSGRFPEHTATMLCEADPALYHFINQGCLTVDNMDDKDEMKMVDRAFQILDIPDDERDGMYRSIGACLHFGEMKFKQRPREEQAEADGTAEAEKVAHLLGVNNQDLLKSLLKPKVKVGAEYVTRGQNKDQVNFAVHAIAKCLYERMFKWLVARVNKTLETKNKRQFFIGVLDIAGFEIFELNTFEQLCINYTNERLQQFFNHHMFVLEQEEYKKEGIHWEFIDFGMDLQACIDLIEKPMGILSILEEECMFPKANDKTLLAKLFENHYGKSEQFGKPRPDKKAKHESHFEIYHYAGTVQYNIVGWLNKNKDPINDTVLQLLASSKEPLVAVFFAMPAEEDATTNKIGKKKKASSYHTISATHKEQLAKLMATLKCTAPHFVRCIIPNEQKQPGMIEAKLVLHQLQCNGVLEGIRICRKGFPNRLVYPEFKQRYCILAPNVIPIGFVDGKIVTEKVLSALDLDPNEYRLGHSKVFFRAGVLGHLEELRDEKLTAIFSNFQAYIRGYHMRVEYKILRNQRIAFTLIQRNLRRWLTLRNWQWWRLYTRVKPLLNMARQEDEMNQMKEEFERTKEELAKVTVQKKGLEDHNVTLLQSKNDMFLQLQAEQDQLMDAEERITSLVAKKADQEQQIKEYADRVNEIEAEVENIETAKRKVEEQAEQMKQDMEGLAQNLHKVETEKTARENQIKTLNDEMTRQDEVIAKTNKEKKNMEENNRKLTDELQAEEDKVNHLNKIKQKQEHAIDELEDNLERERKNRADTEKNKRKVEGELKQTQDNLEELERIRRDLEEALRRKTAECKSVEARLEDEQGLVAQLRKKIKELLARIEELEEELEAERAARAKSEKLRGELQRELDELAERLDEAGGATQAQLELNKKRESEIQKMKRDLEESQAQSEQTIVALKKKQTDAVNELSEQVEQLAKAKTKAEKESTMLKAEIDDVSHQMEHVTRTRGTADKQAKQLDAQMGDMKAKIDNSGRQVVELTAVKAKLEVENAEVTRQLEEIESEVGGLTKAKVQLAKQLEETKGTLEEETRVRTKMQGENRNLKNDLQAAQEQLEEEAEGRAELQRQLTKAMGETQEWRRRMESGEGGVRTEELDDLKRKLNAKLAEAENELDGARTKIAQLEKVKARLTGDLEDVSIEMERAQSIANQAEKRQRAFDKTVDEWKKKVTDLQTELDNALKDGRSTAAEVYKLRAQLEEANESLEAMRRENKNLNEEIQELTDQLGEGGRGVHELEKAKRRLQIEKEELQGALEEAESALEQEEVKSQRFQLEIAAVKQDIDRRLAEKDEEFENTRRNHQRIVESMQASMEAESRGRNEAIRAKKKLEQDINDLEVQLDVANRARAEAEKNYKKTQQILREIQQALEDEKRNHQEARELYGASERHANTLSAELDELRTQLESAERARKMAESDLNEAHDRVSELSAAQASLASAKRKLENDVHAMQNDLDEQAGQIHDAEEGMRKAITDAAQAVEDLRQEQEHAEQIEKMRRALETQVKDLQARLDEADANSLKGGKRMIQKLEARVRELEAELEGEQRRHTDTQKNARKQDRKLKELMFQTDEDKKQIERAQDMGDKLQNKIKVYRRQVEEAEEIAAINLAKYRKVQHELEDAEERADMAENTLSKLRAKNRSSISTARTPAPGGRISGLTTPRRSTSVSRPE